MISKACIVGAYQKKLEEIAAYPDIELTVVVPPYWREGRHFTALERAHVQGYRLVVAPVVFNGHYHVHFYPTLPDILRESRPDVCHVDEEPYNLATCLAIRDAHRVGAKTLFFTWQNLLRHYPYPFSEIERTVYRRVDGAIVGNRDAIRVLRRKGYTGIVRVIPQFGVDPDLFQPAGPRAEDRPFTIGYAGRLVEQKGLVTLLDAVHGLEGDWRLLLYGVGPFREALQTRSAALGLAGRVTFCDHVASTEMPRHLAELDALVLPSLTRPNWKEQFGRVLVEAMACGAPVIGSDSGEIPNVIGDAGLVFPEGQADRLRDALARLMSDRALREDLAAKGRARVLAHYTQKQIAAETVALYRALCAA